MYGTLKRGEPNETLMQKVKTEFIGMAKTVEKYPLIIGTTFNIPAMLNTPGVGHQIVGRDLQTNLGWFLIQSEIDGPISLIFSADP